MAISCQDSITGTVGDLELSVVTFSGTGIYCGAAYKAYALGICRPASPTWLEYTAGESVPGKSCTNANLLSN